MRYMGGKSRLAKSIRDVILGDTDRRERYVEPFIGGGSVFQAMTPHFSEALGLDGQQDLILLWGSLLKGWKPPTELSLEEWQRLRDGEPSALRAFAGFGCSFGGRFFEGYARNKTGANYAAQSSRVLLTQVSEMLKGNPTVEHSLFPDAPIKPGDVVYCDPPYEGTKNYTSKRSGIQHFPHSEFWATARNWAETGAHVYVSEFNAPAGWDCIWGKSRTVGLGEQSGARYEEKVDRLFTYRVG